MLHVAHVLPEAVLVLEAWVEEGWNFPDMVWWDVRSSWLTRSITIVMSVAMMGSMHHRNCCTTAKGKGNRGNSDGAVQGQQGRDVGLSASLVSAGGDTFIHP